VVTRRVAALMGALALLALACGGPAATTRPSTAAATPTAAASAAVTPAATATAAASAEQTSAAASATPAAESPTPAAETPPAASESPAAQSPAAAQCTGQHINFMLSFLANIQHAGFLVAEQEGYYEEEGLDVEIIPAGPGTDVATAVADGTADLGQVDYVPLLAARNAGVPIKAVGQIYKDPFFFWYSSKGSGPATVAEWDGMRVGAIQVGDYPERDAMMIAAGLEPDAITVVPQDFDGLLDPEVMDIAEGVVFFHPALINIIGDPPFAPFPEGYNVFKPADLGADFASQTVAGSEEYLSGNADAVACFLRASIRGWQTAFDDSATAVEDTMAFVPPDSPITAGHQEAALPDVLEITGTGSDDAALLEPDETSYQATIDQLVALDFFEGEDPPAVADTFDRSFWDAAVAGTQP
jgi:NitT/TauT family transport system substrate-binding protein